MGTKFVGAQGSINATPTSDCKGLIAVVERSLPATAGKPSTAGKCSIPYEGALVMTGGNSEAAVEDVEEFGFVVDEVVSERVVEVVVDCVGPAEDCASGAVEVGGDVVVCDVPDVAEDECGAECVVELPEGGLEVDVEVYVFVEVGAEGRVLFEVADDGEAFHEVPGVGGSEGEEE